jgi:hypothetical protein
MVADCKPCPVQLDTKSRSSRIPPSFPYSQSESGNRNHMSSNTLSTEAIRGCNRWRTGEDCSPCLLAIGGKAHHRTTPGARRCALGSKCPRHKFLSTPTTQSILTRRTAATQDNPVCRRDGKPNHPFVLKRSSRACACDAQQLHCTTHRGTPPKWTTQSFGSARHSPAVPTASSPRARLLRQLRGNSCHCRQPPSRSAAILF